MKLIYPTVDYEIDLWNLGFLYVAGLDEVGRGCFAGPVVVGAVIFSADSQIPAGIADSKLLKPKQREKLAEQIKKSALDWSIAEISVASINNMGIGKATQMAFRKAVKSLPIKPDYIVFDAFYNLSAAKISSSAYIKQLKRKYQKPIVKGDQKCMSIAAASIIAKVYRDKLMEDLAKKYPQYGFAKHKGYGTKEHQEAIKKYGLSRIHRKSFNLEKFL